MKILLFGLSLVAMLFLLAGCGGGGGGGSSTSTTTSEETTEASTTASTPASTENESGNFAEVQLTPMNDSGATGTATFTDVAQGVRVELGVQGLPDPNASYLTHIHPGTCADEQGGEEEHEANREADHADHEEGAAEHHNEEGTMAEIEYPLPPITPDPQGRGTTTTVLEGVTVEQLFSGSSKYINVHAEGSGNPPAIACGPLTRS
jgi:Cu/Zn superoxide dismutase